jgi:hypothetical protein
VSEYSPAFNAQRRQNNSSWRKARLGNQLLHPMTCVRPGANYEQPVFVPQSLHV